jgi:hypothetical protein
MTMRRRRLFALPALALVVVLISACGGGSSTSGSSMSRPSTTSTGPDAAVSQSSSESSPQHSRPLPGHPKLDSRAGDGLPGARRRGGSSSRRSRSQTGKPGNASKPATGAAGDSPDPAEQQHAAITRASARAAGRTARRHAQATRRQLESQAGAAAPFLVAQGDNSIPTYGTEASASQRAAAEAVLSGYLAARAEGAWASACSLMSASVTRQLEALGGEAGGAGPSCAGAYAKLSEGIPAAERADPLTQGLTALRVESPHAFALFYGPGGQQYMTPLEEEGGGWKVTQIAPVPWPVGPSGE